MTFRLLDRSYGGTMTNQERQAIVRYSSIDRTRQEFELFGFVRSRHSGINSKYFLIIF